MYMVFSNHLTIKEAVSPSCDPDYAGKLLLPTRNLGAFAVRVGFLEGVLRRCCCKGC